MNRAEFIVADLKKIIDTGIDDWNLVAGACVGLLNAWGLENTPGWGDAEVVIGYPGKEEEDMLELGEELNFGTNNKRWHEAALTYVQYCLKINNQ